MARLLVGWLFLMWAGAALGWPDKPVTIVVPFAPGGNADTLGRLVAGKLGEQLKAKVVVENQAGDEGVAGSQRVAKAAPDGHTLLVSGLATHVIAPLLPRRTPYDPVEDFTHVALFGGPPAVLAVHPSVRAKDLREFVLLARAQPGKLSYGSPGNGTQGHLVAELFKKSSGIEMHHVAYLGAAGTVSDLVAGHVPAISVILPSAAAEIRAGRARGLAISSATRLAEFPDLPTYAELGYPDLVATGWFSLSGPARMPEAVVERLNVEVSRILDLPDVREKLKPEGIVPTKLAPRELEAFMAEELKRWRPIVRAAGKPGSDPRK